MRIKELIGSGDSIGIFTMPFLISGIALNILYPSIFILNKYFSPLCEISVIILIPGLAIWIWSVILILRKVPKRQLITSGPYSFMKHPIYTSVALLVLPWAGFIINTWLGLIIGMALYTGSKIFSKREEEILYKNFGEDWIDYCKKVKLPWL